MAMSQGKGYGTGDGFLMARAWETQGKSTVKLPGQAANRCWGGFTTHACVGFSSILPKDYGKKTGEENGESCWYAGKM